jgi:hypothetical protein
MKTSSLISSLFLGAYDVPNGSQIELRKNNTLCILDHGKPVVASVTIVGKVAGHDGIKTCVVGGWSSILHGALAKRVAICAARRLQSGETSKQVVPSLCHMAQAQRYNWLPRGGWMQVCFVRVRVRQDCQR